MGDIFGSIEMTRFPLFSVIEPLYFLVVKIINYSRISFIRQYITYFTFNSFYPDLLNPILNTDQKIITGKENNT